MQTKDLNLNPDFDMNLISNLSQRHLFPLKSHNRNLGTKLITISLSDRESEEEALEQSPVKCALNA